MGFQRIFTASRAMFSLAGRVIRIVGPDGQLAYYARKRLLRLRDELKVFRDASEGEQLLSIRARGILDFGTTYDVTDVASGIVLGALRRKGLKSILRDEWAVLGPGDAAIATIQEDSLFFALFRRFFAHAWFPQTFTVREGDTVTARFVQHFNPFRLAYDVEAAPGSGVDHRLLAAGALLLIAIEGRQE